MKRRLNILWIVMVVIGALGIEVQERNLSSPAPEPQLGRTAATLGRNGQTVYVAPHVRIITVVWFVLTLAVLVFACAAPGRRMET